MTSRKITNQDAKRILNNQTVYFVSDSSIDYYSDTNLYNAGVYGWNYSIGFSAKLDAYVICGYRIPQTVLDAAAEIIKADISRFE